MQANTDPAKENAQEQEANPQENPATEPQQAAEATNQANEEDGSPNAETSEDPWGELEADVAKWKEISMRTAAEMENLRKRTSREREEAVRYANARLLEELLPVIDNFEMGMQAASEDTSSMIYVGMDMVRKQLNEFLISQGAEEVPTDGLFDPNLHDAVSQEPCDKGEEGRVLRVTRRGFKLHDRLLRPASVVVSKLPSEEEPTDEQAQES